MKKLVKESDVKLLKEATENLPTDEWECEICNTINTNWFPDFALMNKSGIIKYKKGLCENCRRVEDEKIIKDNELIEKENLKLKVKTLLISSQIPPKVLNSTFDNLEVRKGADKAFKIMKRLENADRWIYIHGNNDTGKSSLLGATVNMLATKLIPCYYFNERTLFKRFKDAMDNKNSESAWNIFQTIAEASIIFWDDFSTFDYSKWEKGIAYDLLEYFDQHYKKVVFVSNINLEADLLNDVVKMGERIGKRNIARMKRNKIFYIEMKNEPFN